MNWLKKSMLFNVIFLVVQFKKLNTRQKLKILKKIPNHDKYITTNDFNKLSHTIFDKRLKQAKLATNTDLNTDLNLK